MFKATMGTLIGLWIGTIAFYATVHFHDPLWPMIDQCWWEAVGCIAMGFVAECKNKAGQP